MQVSMLIINSCEEVPYLAKHLQMLDSTHTKKLFIQYLKIAWLSAHIDKIPSSHLLFQHKKVNIRKSRIRSKTYSKLKRKTPEQCQLTMCSCQSTSFWCLFLLILDIIHTASKYFYC